MNKARAMLDALMGPGRDAQLEKDKAKAKEKFKDSDVCKSFLVGMCPMEPAFLGGKRNFQACEKIHSDIMRQQFEAHPDTKDLRREYETVLLGSLKYAVGECDFRINKEKARMSDDWSRKKPPLPAVIIDKLSKLKRESSSLVKAAEELDDDRFEDKRAMTARADELAKEANELEEVELKKAVETGVFEEVCEVCGTCFTGKTADAAHQQFKIHVAYKQIREKFAELDSRRAELSSNQPKADKDGGQEKKGRDRSAWTSDAGPRRGRDKEAADKGEPDLEAHGDKERERNKEPARDRERDRGRSRGRDRDRRRSGSDRSRSRGGRGRDRRRGGSDSDRGRGARRGRKDSRDASRGRRRRR